MYVIQARNVHEALPIGVDYLLRQGNPEKTRNGPAIVAPCPVTTVYYQPLERVIFWPERDANPFFHFFESLWMLAGRNDVAFLSQFNSKIEEYSDYGEIFHGAYGYRWRHTFGIDQIRAVINGLKATPTCRRQVIGIWNPAQDLEVPSKDIPCNLAIHFMVRSNALDMTVFNRSNDMIWGAYGANAVHFSFLQEFIAHFANLPVGTYYQVSDNFHAYTEVFQKLTNLANEAPDPYRVTELSSPYHAGKIKPYPLIVANTDIDTWLGQLHMLLSEGPTILGLVDPFLKRVAVPLMKSWSIYKSERGQARYSKAIEYAQYCEAKDWALACEEWLFRRLQKYLCKEPSKKIIGK